MISQRLRIDTNLGRLNLRTASGEMRTQFSKPFESIQVSRRDAQFSVQAIPSAQITINLDAINSDLGFLRPSEFQRRASSQARGKADSGIAQTVGQGDSDLNNPEGATVSKAQSAAIYSASTQLAVKPGPRPQISASQPQRLQANFQRGQVNVSANPSVSIDPSFQPATANLDRPPQVRVSLVPHEASGFRVDLRA
jgi:hypothetical protein